MFNLSAWPLGLMVMFWYHNPKVHRWNTGFAYLFLSDSPNGICPLWVCFILGKNEHLFSKLPLTYSFICVTDCLNKISGSHSITHCCIDLHLYIFRYPVEPGVSQFITFSVLVSYLKIEAGFLEVLCGTKGSLMFLRFNHF